MPGLIGRKVGMTRVILDDGTVVPVTVISVPDATVVQVKTVGKDGYDAVVLGVEPLKKPSKTKKFRTLKEFQFEEAPEKNATVGIDILQEVEKITISAISKGFGFAGSIKRHNFSSQPASHGHAGKSSKGRRGTGSVGACAKPARIKKGKKMPGRYGNELQTRHRVTVMKVDGPNKLLAVKGQVPGPKGNTVYIKFSS